MNTFSNITTSQTVIDGATQTQTEGGGYILTVSVTTPYSGQIAVASGLAAPVLYGNGVVIPAANYTLTYPTAESLLFTFGSTKKPADTVVITHKVPFYWVVRFDEDSQEFSEFMYQLWELRTLRLKSVPDVVAP